jgi:hypothetical protein
MTPSPPPTSEPVSKTALWSAVVITILVILFFFHLGPHNPVKEEAERNAAKSVVSNGAGDGTVWQVESYLKKNLKDPDSLKFIEWGKVVKSETGYAVRCKYRAKNSFGGYEVADQLFLFNDDGTFRAVKDWAEIHD